MVTRTEFLAQLAGGGWVLLMAGCGGGGSDSNAGVQAPAPAPAAGCSATLVTNNHGHTLSIPAADLNSTVAMSYSIQGTADHPHQITFSAAQLAQLKAGQAVTVTSSAAQGHTHDVTETCV